MALTAGTAHAQWFPFPSPYPGPVIGGIFQGNHVATVRTRVTPRDTQVFVDGYSAGTVDDFDGVFQRLQLIPGQHEITLYLPGYRTYRESVYLNPGSSHDIRHTMVAHAAGEVDDPAPVPLLPPMAGPGRPMPGPPGPHAAAGESRRPVMACWRCACSLPTRASSWTARNGAARIRRIASRYSSAKAAIICRSRKLGSRPSPAMSM